MTISIEVSNSIGNEWNKQLLECPYSTSFQTREWCKLYEIGFNSKPFFVKVIDESGNIVGQLAALLHKNYNWRNSSLTKFVGRKMKLGLSLEWERGPIIHNDDISNEIVSKLFDSINKICEKNNISNFRGTSPTSSNISLFPFNSVNLIRNPWSTYIIQLQTENNFFDLLDKKTRYDIRKSEKANLEFVVVKEKSDFLDYVKLKLNAKHKSKVIKNTSFIEQHWKLLHSNCLEQLFVTKLDGKVISGILCSTFNRNIIQHGVVTSSEIPISGSFLTWKTIQWGIENGFSTYDMGGVNPFPETEKEKGIDFFKSKWGGKQNDYQILTKIFNKSNYRVSRILQDPKRIKTKLKDKFV